MYKNGLKTACVPVFLCHNTNYVVAFWYILLFLAPDENSSLHMKSFVHVHQAQPLPETMPHDPRCNNIIRQQTLGWQRSTQIAATRGLDFKIFSCKLRPQGWGHPLAGFLSSCLQSVLQTLHMSMQRHDVAWQLSFTCVTSAVN